MRKRAPKPKGPYTALVILEPIPGTEEMTPRQVVQHVRQRLAAAGFGGYIPTVTPERGAQEPVEVLWPSAFNPKHGGQRKEP